MKSYVQRAGFRLRVSFAVALVSSIGCATTPASAPGRRVGTIIHTTPICETLTLGNATVSTASRPTMDVDTIAIHVVSSGTATGTWTVTTSSDGSSFSAVTLSTPPPAATGSAQDFWIVYDWWEFPSERVTFTGTGGTGSATVCINMKG